MRENLDMANLLFPNVSETVEEVWARYPPRVLPPGAMVTRLAPSPTGELHIGTLYAAFVSYRLALQSGGVFYLRLDDTDAKRKVEGSEDRIVSQMRAFGLSLSEGFLGEDREAGPYGPYVQSKRAAIYHVFAKRLVRGGKAYPCFCPAEALARMRAEQTAKNEPTGYYGHWAVHREITVEEARQALAKGQTFVLRLRAPGRPDHRLCVNDLFKGSLSMPENLLDAVLLKSDGLPTYHFAHAVDDSLMRTTHVLRGDEWLSSLPLHAQLFEAIGAPMPVYGHLAPILKREGVSKRKFSKRRDSDGHVLHYLRLGTPPEALREYYMHLINSSYEDWRRAHPELPLEAYRIDLSKMSVSGPVLDTEKLAHIAKQHVAGLSPEQTLKAVHAWAADYDEPLRLALEADTNYSLRVLALGRGGKQPRKDLAQWSDVRRVLGYFFDSLFTREEAAFTPHERAFLRAYAGSGTWEADKAAWFAALKRVAQAQGYALDKAAYQANPDAFFGTLADGADAIRRALTGRSQSPDLYDIIVIMGAKRVEERLLEAAREQAPERPTVV